MRQRAASVEDVNRIALSLPEVFESTWFRNRAWKIRSKTFVWLRPLRPKDRAELGDGAPSGPIVGVLVADADDKQAVLQAVEATFTIDHFRNFDAVLIALDRVNLADLEALITDAWLSQAPADLVQPFLDEHRLA